MLQRIDLRPGLPRAPVDVGAATAAVLPIIDDVRARGADAVLDAAERFDGVRPASLRVPVQVIEDAAAALSGPVRDALVESITRVRAGHAAQLPAETVTT